MRKIIVRNDDVAVDTKGKYFDRLKRVTEVVNSFGLQMLQAITVRGRVLDIQRDWNNAKILAYAGDRAVGENTEVMDWLLSRNDLIGVHGLYHFHEPTHTEIALGKAYLEVAGLNPTYFVTPFNEGAYGEMIEGLQVSTKCDSLETLLNPKRGLPNTDIIYLHSWRFDELYTYEALEKALWRITTSK